MKAVIFDLDGTLINSLQNIADCMNQALKEFGFDGHSTQEYKYFIGEGSLTLTKRAVPHNTSQEIITKVYNNFIKIYEENIYKNTQPYDGIYTLLKKLNKTNLKLGILSNKPHQFTKQFAIRLFNDCGFEEVHGQKENIAPKPDAAGALKIAQSFNIKPEEIFYVGDSSTDMKTATNAKMKSIGVLWGFRPKEELIEHKADFLAQDCEQLWDIINTHRCKV